MQSMHFMITKFSLFHFLVLVALVAFSALTVLVERQEGHPACKKWGNGGGGQWFVRMQWRPAGLSVSMPLLIFPDIIKSRSSLLAPAHPDGPGKRAVKRLWCGVVVSWGWLTGKTLLQLCGGGSS